MQALLRFDPRFGGQADEGFTFRDWSAALDHLDELAAAFSEARVVIVIDKFTHLLRDEPGLPSLVQRAWDHRLSRRPNLRLIPASSLMTTMDKDVLSASAPLYGRASVVMRLRPLPYGALHQVFPHWSAPERVAAYGTAGGIRAYLSRLARSLTFVSGLRDHALAPDSNFVTDPALLLHERLTDTAIYQKCAAKAPGFSPGDKAPPAAGATPLGLKSGTFQIRTNDLFRLGWMKIHRPAGSCASAFNARAGCRSRLTRLGAPWPDCTTT